MNYKNKLPNKKSWVIQSLLREVDLGGIGRGLSLSLGLWNALLLSLSTSFPLDFFSSRLLFLSSLLLSTYTLSGRIGKVVASHAAVARTVPALRLH